MTTRRNPLQFAVVREDPDLECEVLRRYPCRRALLVASGGCTALTLAAVFPELEITLLDPNPAQLRHVRAKREALDRLEGDALHAAFNVETDDPQGLSERGNFEALFRGIRGLLHDLVLPREGFRRFFEEPGALREVETLLFEHPCWPVVFRMYFYDPFLDVMFGPDATQHAEPGSYPRYFQGLFERGLRAEGAMDNPFLHHVFLGHYLDRPGCLPRFLERRPGNRPFGEIEGFVGEVEELGEYDFVDLSNIFDWMAPGCVEELVAHLAGGLRPGAVVLYRQLNNEQDLEALFGERFAFDAGLGRDLHLRDRSLFYSSVHVGERMGDER